MSSNSVALYARVSGDRQAQEGTIQSQIAHLREYAATAGYSLNDDLIFIDNGVSGSTLIRPGLDALRDKAFSGQIDSILVLCPDRLARKYAHQLILVEELQKLGVEVMFANRSISNSPEDQLLFQIQGVIAEFEREKIMERSRRGKLYKAKAGCISVLSVAPYGYVYIRASDCQDACLKIHPGEAAVVGRIFKLYTQERMSIRKITGLLNDENIATRHQIGPWRGSVVGTILQNTAYIGRAYYRKTQAVPPKKKRRLRDASKPPKVVNSSRRRRDPQDWFPIEVPTIVDKKTFEMAQKQVAENSRFSPRNRKKHRYLLSGLLRCKNCRYAYYGSCAPKYDLFYYRCIGSNKHMHNGVRKCWAKPVRVDIVDDLVWDQVKRLIENPETVLKEYSNRTTKKEKQITSHTTLIGQKRREIKSRESEKERLLDLYQGGNLEMGEIEHRLASIRLKIKNAEESIQLLERSHQGEERKLELIERFEEFKRKVNLRIANLTFEEKREVLRLVVEEVAVDTINSNIEVKHILPVAYELRPDGGIGQGEPG